MIATWSFFNSHYGEQGPIGDMSHKAQKEWFEYENTRTRVNETTMTTLSADSGDVYPILGPNTTEKDFDEAHVVMSNDTCTTVDLDGYRPFEEGHVEDEDAKDDSYYQNWQPLSAFAEFGVITTVATAFKKAVK